MGRIVINKTENGQTVILNDTPQEVSGGYFDSEMEWYELVGSKSLLYPGTFTFSNGAEAIAEGDTFTFKKNSATSSVGFYTIIDTVYRNNASNVSAGNVQGLRGMYKLQAGDTIRVVLKDIVKEASSTSSAWATFCGCKDSHDNRIFAVNFGSDTEDKDETFTVEEDAIMRAIYFSFGSNVTMLSCKPEVYINGKRII